MALIHPMETSLAGFALHRFDELFAAARKTTIIQIRWPLVILCSYLLLYSPATWLTSTQTHALLIFYLLTNVTLYLVDESEFDSPYFYGPLLFFDTVFIGLSLMFSGGTTPDFYVACLLTLTLSCICNDSRGLLVVTLLSPVLYGYIILNSTVTPDPSIYLRLPFPLVISMFYGYFGQVERLKRIARENEVQARRHQRAAEEIRQQRERLQVLHEVNVAVTSTIDFKEILDAFFAKVLDRLPYAATMVQLRNPDTGILETVAARGIETTEIETFNQELLWVGQMMQSRTPLIVANALTDTRVENYQFFRNEGFVSFASAPLLANGEVSGSLIFLTRDEHDFSQEELGFLSTLAGHVGIAIHHSQLFQQIQQQAEALRNANKVKDEFLGVVSHELRTPLNVISGYTNMLLERMMGEISPIQEKALHTVERQSKELHGLINSVLQVSSIEGGTIRADRLEVNMWEFVAELRSSYDVSLAKEVKLVWEIPANLPTVYTDRAKLKHVLQNLINNAIKFTDQGSVTVSLRYLTSKDLLEFSVTDTGIGIPENQLSAIFDRFRQVDSSDTRTYGGVGLGLYIVKKFTNLLAGTIKVKSQLGQGSTFTLLIPCQRPKASSESQRLLLPDEIEASTRSMV